MVSGRFVPRGAVDRPALRRELDAALDRAATLVVAQAGAGKSVLLSQWADTLDRDVVWIDIVESDNDPAYLTSHLLSAFSGLASAAPQPGDVFTVGPGLGRAFIESFEEWLRSVPPVVVIVDDLHVLRNVDLLADIVGLRAPGTLSVVAAGRTDPPIAWSRNRLRGDVGEIRQSALAMTAQEGAELVRSNAGVDLDAATVAALVERTEGWAAGLQLAAASLRVHPDPVAFVARFSGSDRLIADYLSEEVMRSLRDDLRRFLLTASALDTMSVELLTHVSDDDQAGAMLEDLDRNSTFLIPVDERREWFRFHQLFRDLLRYQARVADPGSERRLLVRAAEWHLERGETTLAIGYLHRAREWQRTIDLVLARGSDVFEQGEVLAVMAWIIGIPEAAREHNLDLTLLLGILQVLSGRADIAEDTLQRVAGSAAATPGQQACAATALAALVQWRPNPRSSIAWAVRAVTALDANPDTPFPDLLHLTDVHSLATIATVSGGRAYFLAGEFAHARRWLERALATQGASYSIWRISALGSLALLDAWTGRMPQANALSREALSIAHRVSMESHPSTAEAHLARALVMAARGHDAEARQSFHDGLVRVDANGRTQLAWLFYASGRSIGFATADDEPPHGTPPPVAAEMLATVEQRGAGWVTARSERAPDAPGARLDATPAPIADPLTDRELEILAFLPTRITTAELAEQCFVSVNTIKTHLAHISRKLGVTNRRGAISRATELGLLRW